SHRHTSLPQSFLLEFPSIEASERPITTDGVDSRFAPEVAQHGVALLGHTSETLTIATRVFSRDQPHVAGHSFGIRKSVRISEKHFGGQSRHRSNAGMRHETTGLRSLIRLVADALIELVDLIMQMPVERLQLRSSHIGMRPSVNDASSAWPARLHRAARRRMPCPSARPCKAFMTRVRIGPHYCRWRGRAGGSRSSRDGIQM